MKAEVRQVQSELSKEMAAMQRNILKVLIERTPDNRMQKAAGLVANRRNR